ncbi:blue light receptor [Colletotrichum karsti]|uniref:Blue light receptor n=1 Tax=Colletotrichum karsti TaxID=1095194 RepID=A0A9P6LKS8_9PEZI|nr:blue light receptor [Colletotrichum karsti]KAF9876405.1 blue light receptor [Colletotrichum karsti]
MAPVYDIDDDAAHLPRAANGNASKAIPTGTIDDELFTRVLPRVDMGAIEEARNAFGHESDDDSDAGIRRPQQRGRSLSESSIMMGPVGSHPERDTDVSVDGGGGEASRPGRESIDFNRSARPLSRGDLVPQDYSNTRPDKDTIPVPTRGSSRPDRASIDSNGRISSRRDYNIPQRPPRAEEVEAAKRILAQVIESEQYYSSTHRETHSAPRSPRGARSATPPPIGRPHRTIIYESDEEDDVDSHQDNHNGTYDYHEDLRNEVRADGGLVSNTPVTAIHNPIEDTGRPPTSNNRQSRSSRPSRVSSRQSSQPPPTSRAAASLAAHKRELRTPVLDHARLYDDAEPPPISQRRPDNPRSRRATYKKFADMEEEHFHDFSVKNGSETRLDIRPATADRRAMSDDSISISRQSTSKHSIASNGSANRTVDFFGPGIFQVVLHNPTTSHQLLKFAEARFCSESVEFLKKVEQYQTTLNDLAGIMTSIHKDYLSESSAKQINVNGELRKSVHTEMKSTVTKTLPAMEALFTDLQESVEQDVFLDIYPRFVRYQMALSATRALATNRHSYQGLGDCFCLTNPAVADNPIVYASDGFVKVTGYSRPEIIPRNCRFLQGAHTDRHPIRRLKNAIEERKESVELILNYKKNGDPFWNLLYVAPLYNEAGKLAFFIGGQINCSTTIHSNVDVMRVLSTSTQDDTQDETKSKTPPLRREGSVPSARKAFLKALGVRVDDHGPNGVAADAGMENKLLQRMEGQGLNAQMKEFYTAYSKYLVLSYDSFIIRFYSEGVMEMLHPANNTIGLVTGQEIFRFFKQNMVNHQSDYKTRVRNAIRAGSPISLEVRLQTRRSALFRGDERFMTHWTPLKDEKSAVHWVVLTLAPTIS